MSKFNHGEPVWAPASRFHTSEGIVTSHKLRKAWVSLEATEKSRTMIFWGEYPDESQGGRWEDNNLLMTKPEWELVQATKGI